VIALSIALPAASTSSVIFWSSLGGLLSWFHFGPAPQAEHLHVAARMLGNIGFRLRNHLLGFGFEQQTFHGEPDDIGRHPLPSLNVLLSSVNRVGFALNFFSIMAVIASFAREARSCGAAFASLG